MGGRSRTDLNFLDLTAQAIFKYKKARLKCDSVIV